ncbi:MAG: RebB family R body protein [Acidobacteriota bacterium]
MSSDSVNSQVADAVTTTDALVVGSAPASAMAMVDAAMAASVGTLMQNAVSAQKNGQLIATSSVATTCSWIIKKGTGSP